MNEWVESLSPEKVDKWIKKRGAQACERYYTDDIHFALWMSQVDRACQSLYAMSIMDLEDWDYTSAYDGDMGPREALSVMADETGLAEGIFS